MNLVLREIGANPPVNAPSNPPAIAPARVAGYSYRVARLAAIVAATWLIGGVAIDIVFGPAAVVHSQSGSIALSGAIALAVGIGLAWWYDRRERSRIASQTPVPQPTSQPIVKPSIVPFAPDPTLAPRASATKVCPDCAETVQAAARICRYCRYEFAPRPY